MFGKKKEIVVGTKDLPVIPKVYAPEEVRCSSQAMEIETAKGKFNRDGDYKNLLNFMSSHKKCRISCGIKSEVSQSDVDLTNLKYLIPNAMAKGLVGVPKNGYADQSMLDNNDLVGSYLDNAEASDKNFYNNLSKEKTEKKENEKAPQATENNSQGTADGGLA